MRHGGDISLDLERLDLSLLGLNLLHFNPNQISSTIATAPDNPTTNPIPKPDPTPTELRPHTIQSMTHIRDSATKIQFLPKVIHSHTTAIHTGDSLPHPTNPDPHSQVPPHPHPWAPTVNHPAQLAPSPQHTITIFAMKNASSVPNAINTTLHAFDAASSARKLRTASD
jgi:hypothetical protein